jgi:kinesin family protein C1
VLAYQFSGSSLPFAIELILLPLVCLRYNVCIFAYGQTGSGKTYTMTGEDGSETRGLIPRAVNFLFEEMASLEARGWEFSARASFLEIYNEQIRDLLDDSGEQKQHTVKMAKDGMQFISNLQELTVESSEDLAELMQVALTNRAVATSEMNERSSRSHSVCRITLVGTRGSTQIQSTINMVDLAGSERLSSPSKAEIDLAPLDERAALHENASKRQAETLAINKSLSALASVIQAVRVKSNHVPYRDSKLTYVLQDALGKDSKCLMMVNVSPRTDCLNETLCSLRFASKVNDTTRGPAKRNITTDKPKRSLPSVCKPE